MNKRIGVLLVVYGGLLGGVSCVVYHLAPAGARPTLIAGLAGGALCLLWGAWGMAGAKGKALPLMTLIPVSFVLLSQTFTSWSGASGAAAGLITLLLVLSLAMLVRIAWSGVVFDLAPEGRTKAEGAGSGREREKGSGV